MKSYKNKIVLFFCYLKKYEYLKKIIIIMI